MGFVGEVGPALGLGGWAGSYGNSLGSAAQPTPNGSFANTAQNWGSGTAAAAAGWGGRLLGAAVADAVIGAEAGSFGGPLGAAAGAFVGAFVGAWAVGYAYNNPGDPLAPDPLTNPQGYKAWIQRDPTVGIQCFPAGTVIRLPEEQSIEIESVAPGMQVAAFDSDANNVGSALISAEVRRIFRGVTTEWLKLSNGIIVTAGHLFYNERGQFERADSLVRRRGQLVRDNGTLEKVSAERIVYSEQTRYLFEEAEEIVYAFENGAAFAPQVRRGWRTYNFEVKNYHTYIAGGYRVHNESTVLGDLSLGISWGAGAVLGSAVAGIRDVGIGLTAAGVDLAQGNIIGAFGDVAGGVFAAGVDVVGGVLSAGIDIATGIEGAAGAAVRDIEGIFGGAPVNPDDPLGGFETTVADAFGGIDSTFGGLGNVVDAAEGTVGDVLGGFLNSFGQPADESSDRFDPASPNPAAGDGGALASALGFGGVAENDSGNGPAPDDSSDGSNADGNDNSKADSGDNSGGYGGDNPVVLNLDGKGLKVTSISSSTQFVNLNGDGYQHRTAWAGARNGVLVLDLDGDGKISQKDEYVFTAWDPTASSDLQALKDVFDTNHDGKLDAGDADWSKFKVMVNGQLVTLASLGITSIDLTPTGSGETFNDGSAITGTTTYTKSDGSTGQVGDATLATDANGYLIHQTQTTNGDGSITTDILGYNADGSEAFENVVTVSANGASKTTRYDDNGDGVFDRSQTDNTVANADGSSTETISDFNADSSLKDRTATTTSADTKTVTTQVDQNGDGIWDQSQVFVTNSDHSTSTTTKNLAANGATINQTQVTTSADGLTKTTQVDHSGTGNFDQIKTDVTVVNADGSRTRTVSLTSNNGALLSKSVTATSADARTKTVQTDNSGSGTFDLVTASAITVNADNSVTTTVSHRNADNSLRDKTVTTISADGLSKTVSRDLNGDGVADAISADVTTIGGDGSRTETVTDKSGNGTLLSQSVTATSADKKTITITTDANGDGATDQTTSIVIGSGGSTTKTVSNFAPGGALVSRTLTTSSANGLSRATETDINGDGTYDAITTDVTVKNADGSSTETVTDTSANGALIDKSIINTSASGLVRTKQQDLDGNGSVDRTTTDTIVLNADGSRTETVSVTSNSGALLSKTVTTESADRLTTTVNIDRNGDGHIDEIDDTILQDDGSVMHIVGQAANDVLVSQTITITSANGLSTSSYIEVSADTTGHQGELYRLYNGILGYNADANGFSTWLTQLDNGTQTAESIAASMLGTSQFQSLTDTQLITLLYQNALGHGPDAAALSQWQTAIGNGMSRADVALGIIDSVEGKTHVLSNQLDWLADTYWITNATQMMPSDITVLNADGSKTETKKNVSTSGAVLGTSIITTSGNGLSVTTQTDADGDGVMDSKTTDITTINADGSRTETVSNYNGAGSVLRNQTVTTVSANGLSKTVSEDINGDGTVDEISSDVVVLNADGSTSETVAKKSGNGTLVKQTVTTTSADKRTVTTTNDLNGDGIVDQTTLQQTGADGTVTTTTFDGSQSSTYGWTHGTGDSRRVSTSANGLQITIDRDTDGDGKFDSSTSDVTVVNADGSKVETIAYEKDTASSAANPVYTYTLTGKRVITTSANGLSVTTQMDGTGAGSFSRTNTSVKTLNADGSVVTVVSDTNANGSLHDKTTTTVSGDQLTTTVATDINGDGTVDQTVVTHVNADGSVSTSSMDGTVKSASGRSYGGTDGRYETDSANGLSKTIQYDANGDGLAESQTTDVTVLNADGSRVETITDASLSGGTATSASPAYTATTKDREVITTSGNGLSVTRQYDLTGSGSFGSAQTDQTLLQTDGSSWHIVGQVINGQLKKQIFTVINADGIDKGTYWEGSTDSTGHQSELWRLYNGILGSLPDWNGYASWLSQLNNGSQTAGSIAAAMLGMSQFQSMTDAQLITMLYQNALGHGPDAAALAQWQTSISNGMSRANVALGIIDSAEGISHTQSIELDWETDAAAITHATLISSTDTTAVNADGSVAETITNTRQDGSLISKTVKTTSADGRTVTLQQDPNGTGNFTQSSSTTTLANGDGSQTVTVKDFNGDGSLKDSIVKQVSGDGLTTTISTDANGDGTVDQTRVMTKLVDGSTSTVITDLTATGAKADQMTSTTSYDGLTTTTGWDINGDGVIDRSQTDTRTANADGSTTQTIQDFNVSQTSSAGVVSTISPVLLEKRTAVVSADGKTRTATVDINGDGVVDETAITVTNIDGSVTTTVTNDAVAQNTDMTEQAIVHPGDVVWKSPLANAGAYLAAKSILTVSADGLTETIKSDYDGNGTYEHTETWQTQIDGSKIATIQDVNASGAIVAQGTETISADGLTTTLKEDTNNDGVVDHTDTTIRNADGSKTETITDLNANGSLNETTTENINAIGELTKRYSTYGTGVIDYYVNKADTAAKAAAGIVGVEYRYSSSTQTAASLIYEIDTYSDNHTLVIDDHYNQTWSTIATYYNANGTTNSQHIVYDNGQVDDVLNYADNAAKAAAGIVKVQYHRSADSQAYAYLMWETDTYANGTARTTYLNGYAPPGGYTPTPPSYNSEPTHGGENGGEGGGGDNPVILDLTGNGLKVAPLSSSTQFVEQDGDGYRQRTAWAGAGNGVLMLDLNGDVQITQADEYQFTQWDPTATSDLQALEDVFDTNHDGKLDAGDADWSKFKVMVNGQLVSLGSLGITSIDLTPKGSGEAFGDGSAITGTTTYTRSDGTTGAVGDATFAVSNAGYLTRQTVASNVDGSVTTDIVGDNADGSEAFENIVTVSADGLSKTTEYDDAGNGIINRSQTDNTVDNADGSTTVTITSFDANGSKTDQTVTTTSADTKTVTTLVDNNGDGVWDQSTVFNTNADGSSCTTTRNFGSDGSLSSEVVVIASADGLSKIIKTDKTGSGTFDLITSDVTVINADGSRTETLTNTDEDGDLLARTVTTTSADGRNKTIDTDNTGSGSFDALKTSSIVIGADGSVSTTVKDMNIAGVLQDETVSTVSADGLSKVVSTDSNGDGVIDRVSSDVTTIGSDGSRTRTVTDNGNDGVLLDKTITVESADQKTLTTTVDTNVNGASLSLYGATVNIGGGIGVSIGGNNNTILLGQNSTITASGSSDHFVFTPSFGNDTITGYQASGTGADQINIDHSVFADWATLLSHTAQAGADTIITADANDTITLKNTTVASLQQGNFHFT